MAKYNFGSGWLYVNGIPMNAGSDLFGIGSGNIKYLVTAKNTATNLYYAKLHKNGVLGSDIFTDLATAYARTTSDQNDVIVVTPGTYTVTESLTWDNDNTHLFGLAGPLSRGGMGSSVYFNCATAEVEQLIKVDGHNVRFHNIYLRNAGADALNLTALKCHKGENFYAENCQFVGHAAATQVDTAATSSLWLYSDATGKPWGANFVNCRIGSASETVRTAGSVIYASGATALTQKYVKFKNCEIESYSETAACPAVHIAASFAGDRYMLFDDCFFYNFSVNHANSMTEVFNDDSGSTHEVILKGSTCAMGYSSWDSAGIGYVYHTRGVDAAGYGLMEVASSG